MSIKTLTLIFIALGIATYAYVTLFKTPQIDMTDIEIIPSENKTTFEKEANEFCIKNPLKCKG